MPAMQRYDTFAAIIALTLVMLDNIIHHLPVIQIREATAGLETIGR